MSYNLMNGGIGRADPIAEVLEALDADAVVLFEADNPGVLQRIAGRLRMDLICGTDGEHTVAILSKLVFAATVDHAAITGASAAALQVELMTSDGSVFTILATAGAAVDNGLVELKLATGGGACVVSGRGKNSALPAVLAKEFQQVLPQRGQALREGLDRLTDAVFLRRGRASANVRCEIIDDRLALFASDALPLVVRWTRA